MNPTLKEYVKMHTLKNNSKHKTHCQWIECCKNIDTTGITRPVNAGKGRGGRRGARCEVEAPPPPL